VGVELSTRLLLHGRMESNTLVNKWDRARGPYASPSAPPESHDNFFQKAYGALRTRLEHIP
jgi:hypothetical protein